MAVSEGKVIVDKPDGVACWAARQANGLYMLTEQKPVLSTVGRSLTKDFYVPIGDPIGVRNLCAVGFAQLSGGLVMKRGERAKIRLWCELIEGPLRHRGA